MIYKYILSISGDNFNPLRILNKIQGDFVVDDYFSPNDKNHFNKNEIYENGSITFIHPNKFSTQNEIIKYENSIIKFIESNFNLFIENSVEQIEIYMEIYFDGGQCNFEIFSKEILKKLTDFNVSLPISIYVLNEVEIKNWESEINSQWKNN